MGDTPTLHTIPNTLFFKQPVTILNSRVDSLLMYGGVTINNTQDATEVNAGGSFTTFGGFSVQKKLFVGGEAHFKDTTESDATTTGALVVSGGAGILKNVNIGGQVNVAGEFNVISDATLGSSVIVTGPGLKVPVGTTEERPNDEEGFIRFNTETSQFEGYGAGAWGSLGGVVDVDQDTFILAEQTAGSNENTLQFVTANVERMTIRETGLIGMGTTDPQVALDLVGDLRVSAGATIGSDLRVIGDSQLEGAVSIVNTESATSLTAGGAFTVAGGASVEKNAFIGSNLVVTTKDITPSLGDIAREKEFAGSSNTTASITGFAFSNALTRAFNAIVSVQVLHDAQNVESNQYANYEIKGLQKNGSWVINSSYIGDNTGITFAISSDGQVSYTSPDFGASFSELIFRFKATTTSIYDVNNDSGTIASYTGGTIVLSGTNTPWTQAGAEVYYQGNVGIGTDDPTYRLHVAGGNALLDGYVTTGELRVTGDLYVDGTANIAGLQFDELSLTASTIGNLIVTGGTTHGGHFVPSADVTYDLGSSTLQWRDLFLSGNTINLGGTAISASTAGTISFGDTVLATTTTANVSTSLGGGVVTISNTTNAIDASTGALVVGGGLGVAKDMHVAGSMTTGSINIDGVIFQNGVPYTGSQWSGAVGGEVSYTSGNVVVETIEIATGTMGSLKVDLSSRLAAAEATSLSVSGDATTGNLRVDGSAIFAGDLTVYGSQTQVTLQSTTLEIGDNLIKLNAGPLGLADAGLLIGRGTEGQYAVQFYNTPENEFVFGYTTSDDTTGSVTLSSDSLSGNSYADVRLQTLNALGDINMTAGTATLSNANVTTSTMGAMYVSGNVGIGTTNPQYKLQVAGEIASSGLRSDAQLVLSSRETTGGLNLTGDWLMWVDGHRSPGGSVARNTLVLQSGTSEFLTLRKQKDGVVGDYNRVGLFNLNPEFPLDVNGAVRIQGGGLMATSDSNTIGSIFTSGGNVGIGTTSPRGVLDIKDGDVYLVGDSVNGNNGNVYMNGHVYFVPLNGGNVSYLQARRSDESGSTEMDFTTMNSGTVVEAMRINSVGNVGIGVADPGYNSEVLKNMRVNGRLSSPAVVAGNIHPPCPLSSTTQTIGGITYKVSVSSQWFGNGVNHIYDSNTSNFWEQNLNGSHYYFTNSPVYNGIVSTTNIDGGGMTMGEWTQMELSSGKRFTHFRMRSNAQRTRLVGSNDNANWTTIDYRNLATYTTNAIAVQSPGTYLYYRLILEQVSNPFSEIRFYELEFYEEGQLDVSGNVIINNNMHVKENGNVGIGRTDPAVPLDISGGASIGTYSYHYLHGGDTGGASQNPSNVSARASGRMVASEFNAVSDERIKKDAADITDENALATIRLIQPKTYKYIDEVRRGSSLVYGFMAQQVEQVLPHAVKKQKDYLPSVYGRANVTITGEGSSLITLEVERSTALPFAEGARVLLYSENAETKATVKTIVSNSSFEVLEEIEEQTVFVYGQEDDVLTLNKDSIFTVATAALQEVDRQLQAEKEAHQITRNELAALATRVAVLETAA